MNGSVYRFKTAKKARRVLPLCLCAVAGIAILTMAAPSFAQSNDVMNRIKRLENEIDTLNRAVYKGEKPPVIPEGAGPNAGAFEPRIAQMESDLRTLTGKVEQQSYDIQQLQQQVEALTQDTRMRLDAIEAQLRAGGVPAGMPAPMADTNTIPPPGMTPSQEAGLPSVLQPDPATQGAAANVTGNETGVTDAASLYEQGFGQIKSQDYEGAEKSFIAFMKEYPTHALAPNALYWLGETYYVRKNYDKASRAFAEAYQKYPDGPKGADNLLKLGMSLAGKGEKENACIALGQLKKEYPKGPQPVLQRGDQEMATLGCP